MTSPSPIPGVPFEVVLAIVNAIKDVATLNAVSRTCRDLYGVAMAPLYRLGLARDEAEMEYASKAENSFDFEEVRDYETHPYSQPIALWAAAADASYGLPVLERAFAARPSHLWASFHLPAGACASHWPWVSEADEGPISIGQTTALHTAVTANNLPTVRWLLEHRRPGVAGAASSLEAKATYVCTCPSRHLQVLIRDHHVEEAEDAPCATPLHLALSQGHVEVAKLLINYGANWAKFSESCHGVTGLMIIAANGLLPMLEWLVRNDMLRYQDVEFEDNLGLRARDYASYGSDESTASLVRKLLSSRKLDQHINHVPAFESRTDRLRGLGTAPPTIHATGLFSSCFE